MRAAHFALPLFLALAPAGCGGTDADDAELSGLDDGKADSVSTTSTYYTMRRDLRKCIAPLCGGFWVKRVNFKQTKCVDGKWADECYVAEADFSPLGLTDEEAGQFQATLDTSLVRGKIVSRAYQGFGTLAAFNVTEGWRAATANAPTGVFYRVTDNGRRCFTWPCESFHEAKLNSTISANIAGVDLSRVGASEEQVDAAFDELFRSGILANGTHSQIKGPGGVSRQLDAAQFYTRVKTAFDGTCGGFIGKTCPKGQYCDVTVQNACGGADLPGTCKDVPEICIQIYKPVCGCDGVTYSNDCHRLGAQVQLDHEGECLNGK